MTQISISDVQKLASLSALELTDKESESLARDIINILGYVEQLNAIDTEGVEPTYQVNQPRTVVRKDVVIDYGVTQADLLKNAADTQDNQVKVPRVLE